MMVLKLSRTLGPRKSAGDVPVIRCLVKINRFVQPALQSASETDIDDELDGRHVEIIVEQLGGRQQQEFERTGKQT